MVPSLTTFALYVALSSVAALILAFICSRYARYSFNASPIYWGGTAVLFVGTFNALQIAYVNVLLFCIGWVAGPASPLALQSWQTMDAFLSGRLVSRLLEGPLETLLPSLLAFLGCVLAAFFTALRLVRFFYYRP